MLRFRLIAGRHRWRPPFIYSPGDIEALMAQARQLTPMPAATHETLIGLLAVTGLRVGEAIRLDRADIDWTDAVLTIRESKFGKSRLVPPHPSTMKALASKVSGNVRFPVPVCRSGAKVSPMPRKAPPPWGNARISVGLGMLSKAVPPEGQAQ